MYVAPEDVDERTVVARGRHVGDLEVDGLALLVDEGAGRAQALNPTATLVWRHLDGTSTLAELIDDLSDVYGAPRSDVADGVVSLVRNLGALGLLAGVEQSVSTMPIDVQFVDPDDCAPDPGAVPAETPSFDSRYLAAPPNT